MRETANYDAIAGKLFIGFLRRTHLSAPSDIATVAAEEAAAFGATETVIYLVDHEQRTLVPLRTDATQQLKPLSIDGTAHGQTFTTSTIIRSSMASGVASGTGTERLLVPLLDGTERLGTAEYIVSAPDGTVPEQVVLIAERYSHLIAQTILTKSMYGDVFELARRSRAMAVSAELIRGMLPPLVFATRDVVIAGMAEPAYSAGGDAFDYAVNGSTAHLAIFDAMGHGLAAAGDASFAVAAYRAARRRELDLAETYRSMDDAIRQQQGDRFVTAILAELDLPSGALRWLSAGHPAPLLLRDRKLVKTLDCDSATPLGVPFGDAQPTIAREDLEPGDQILLYTDGVPEARLSDGSFFTVERLAEFVERQAAAGFATPETLRRLRHAILEHQHGQLQDDATALLVEWAAGAERRLLPQTVR
ncbi:MAG TPA: PP2C family protein-serine/threonine phosphatase [Mycobacteriales bacterium]|nr:PP2C family protein-serine/threonine phosphatase [Mycobacteriales bacterium]